MFKQILLILGFATLYLLFKFPPAQVLPYQNYQPPADFSAHIKPSRFSQIQLIQSPLLQSPQDLQIDFSTGDIYTGNSKGTILKISPNFTITTVLQGSGPILKLSLNKSNNLLYYIDSGKGICRAHLLSKQSQTLVPFKSYGMINSFDISTDNTIYFTETSSRFALSEAAISILSGRPDGNIYSYNPSTNTTTKILSNLYSPNGIQISPDGNQLFISEMGKYRVIKYNLKTKKTTTVIENLEAGPDNLRFNEKGELWIGLPVYRDSFQELLLQTVWLRNLLCKLSSSLINKFLKSEYVGAMKVSREGKVLNYIKEKAEKYQFLSTAMEYEGNLYFGSFKFNAVGKIPIEGGKVKENNQRKQEEL